MKKKIWTQQEETQNNDQKLRATGKAPSSASQKKKDKKEESKKSTIKVVVGLVCLVAGYMILAPHGSKNNGPSYNTALQWDEKDKNKPKIYLPEKTQGITEHYNLVNNSEKSVKITGNFLLKDSDFDSIINEDCTQKNLDPASACSVEVLFKARKKDGEWNDTLTNPTMNIEPLSINGTYNTRDKIFDITIPTDTSLSSTSYPGPIKSITIKNSTDQEQSALPLMFVQNPSQFQIISNNCDSTLKSAESCTVDIQMVSGQQERSQSNKNNQSDYDVASADFRVGNDIKKVTAKMYQKNLTINQVTVGDEVTIYLKNRSDIATDITSLQTLQTMVRFNKNTCGDELKTKESCMFQLYAPKERSIMITIAGQSIVIKPAKITVQWKSGSKIKISEPDKIPYASDPFDIDITNEGPGDIQDPYNRIKSSNENIKITQNTCPSGNDKALAQGQSCKITLIAVADHDGSIKTTLSIGDISQYTLEIPVSGFSPKIDISGDKMWNSRGVVLVKNTGRFKIDNPVALISINTIPENSVSYEGCQTALNPNSECGIILTRNNPSVKTARSDFTNQTDHNVHTTFMAMGAPKLIADTNALNLFLPNTINAQSNQYIQITNSGLGHDHPKITLEGNLWSQTLGSNTCNTTLEPGETCSVDINTIAGKPIIVEYNTLKIIGDNNEIDIPIKIQDTAKPLPEIEKPTFSINSDGIIDGHLTIKNMGRKPYNLPDDNNWSMNLPEKTYLKINQSDNCKSPLNPSESCTYTISGTTSQKSLNITTTNEKISFNLVARKETPKKP